MIILPSMKRTFISNMTPEEICAALRAVTVTRKEFYCNSIGNTGTRPEFIGTVGDWEFKIVRLLEKSWYRDSFLPIIIGSVSIEKGWSVVKIRMRMHLFVCVFSAVWLGIVGLVLLSAILVSIVDKTLGMLWPVALMMLFGQVLIRTGFYMPAKKAMKRMEELLGVVRSVDF